EGRFGNGGSAGADSGSVIAVPNSREPLGARCACAGMYSSTRNGCSMCSTRLAARFVPVSLREIGPMATLSVLLPRYRWPSESKNNFVWPCRSQRRILFLLVYGCRTLGGSHGRK